LPAFSIPKTEDQFAIANVHVGAMPKRIWSPDGKSRRGEMVYIVKGRQRFILQEVPEIEPVPSVAELFPTPTAGGNSRGQSAGQSLGDSRAPKTLNKKGTP